MTKTNNLTQQRIKTHLSDYQRLEDRFGLPKAGAIFNCLKALQESDRSVVLEMEDYLQAQLGVTRAEQRRLASQYDMFVQPHPNGANHQPSQKLHRTLLGLSGEPKQIRHRGPLLSKVNENSSHLDAYLALGGYTAARQALNECSPEQILDEVKTSQLRGRGGAFFPVGIKWEAATKQEAERRFLICNADEGEPPTRKDKLLMERAPHLLIEGMLIAAKAIGVRLGIVYVRGDYEESLQILSDAVSEAQADGWLGEDIQGSGFSFDIHIFAGSGSYVAGCDTAMIESLEGKAAMPRPTPPYPVENGLAGYPTVVNNVETLCNIPIILEVGGESFATTGSPDCTGTQIFGLCGDIAQPGFYELPIGFKLDDLITMGGGVIELHQGQPIPGRLKAVSPGGATTGLLNAEEVQQAYLEPASLAIYGANSGSGAVAVFNQQRDLLDYAQDVLDFLAEESCGNCIQCTVSIRKAQHSLSYLRGGKASLSIVDEMTAQARLLAQILKCGLGRGAYNTAISAAAKFPEG